MTSKEIDMLLYPCQLRRSWFRQRNKYFYTIDLIRTNRDESVIGDIDNTDRTYANITAMGATFEEAGHKANFGIVNNIATMLIFANMKLDRLQQKKTRKK